MKQTFDPHDPAALDAALADLAQDEVALRPAFRDQLVADAIRANKPATRQRRWVRLVEWLGVAGLPAAALTGAWIGVTNPVLVLEVSPWPGDTASLLDMTDGDEDDLLVEVFGGGWDSLGALE